MVFIYHLLDECGRVRYVGKTIDPKARLNTHMNCGKGNPHLRRWLRKMRRHGFAPKMVIAQTISGNDWQSAERNEIRKQRELGARLCNATEGGESGLAFATPEIKRKLDYIRQRYLRKLANCQSFFTNKKDEDGLSPRFVSRHFNDLPEAPISFKKKKKCKYKIGKKIEIKQFPPRLFIDGSVLAPAD